MTNDEISRYMTESNNTLGEWQVVGLAKIAAFYKDRNGDYTRVNAAQFSTMVQAVIGTVRERQAEHKAHHGR